MIGRKRGAGWAILGTLGTVALLAAGGPALAQESQEGGEEAWRAAESDASAEAPRATEEREAGADAARLSPLDSVTAVIAGARIDVRYGRPSMRGRRVFGRLVPWGEIWRTGANEATQLRTSADLRIGETRVPAGHYTLWTIPAREGWTLIVNAQIGQWGTQYDPERDVLRVPMRTERLRRPVENFTIGVEASDGTEEEVPSSGRLWMEWERVRAWVPIQVLPLAEDPHAPEPAPGG